MDRWGLTTGSEVIDVTLVALVTRATGRQRLDRRTLVSGNTLSMLSIPLRSTSRVASYKRRDTHL